MQIQKRIKGGRQDIYGCLHPRVRAIIEADVKRFDVSISFVVATALEHFFGKMLTEHYYEAAKRKPKPQSKNGKLIRFNRSA